MEFIGAVCERGLVFVGAKCSMHLWGGGGWGTHKLHRVLTYIDEAQGIPVISGQTWTQSYGVFTKSFGFGEQTAATTTYLGVTGVTGVAGVDAPTSRQQFDVSDVVIQPIARRGVA